MRGGYDEQTYISPGRGEVCGQDGFGWYCYKQTAAECFPKTPLTPSKNPLFAYLEGMTAAKLRRRGFVT